MVVSLLLTKLKHFLLFFVTIFRRALCCIKRRRRPSNDSPLTHVGVVSDSQPIENWSWDEGPQFREPKTVQDHIELYRKRKTETVDASEENVNFFEDMAPKITRQTKVFISTDQGGDGGLNRLNVVDAVPVDSGELREWEEGAGWEGETLDWDAQEALREKKKRDRERKLWEQRQERAGRSLGARVST